MPIQSTYVGCNNFQVQCAYRFCKYKLILFDSFDFQRKMAWRSTRIREISVYMYINILKMFSTVAT